MTKFLTGVAAVIVAFIVIFICIPLRTLFGGIVGWVTGIFFGTTILAILNQVGVHGFTMWQIGLFLGFVSAFFVSTVGKKE